MRTILIVANQTLPGEPLAREVAERILAGATEFFVVVPVTPAPGGGLTWDEDEARRSAEERLASFVERLQAQGMNATGEVGDRDPVQAVRTPRVASRSMRSSSRRCPPADRAGSARTSPAASATRSTCRSPSSSSARRPPPQRVDRARSDCNIRLMRRRDLQRSRHVAGQTLFG